MKGSLLNDAFFSRLETMTLNMKSSLAGYFGGKHLVRNYGQTVEFADFREYQLGDDIRRIDWNLFSRFEKYFLRLYTDERQMHVQIFLDCSASMGSVDPRKAAYSVAATAALGFLAVHNMDKLSVNLMQGNISSDPFGTIVGKNSFFRAVGTLEETAFEGETDIEKAVKSCANTGSNNGLTVIISDFFTESDWKKAVDYLLYKKREVLLLQVLTPEEAGPTYDGRINLLDAEAVDESDTRNLKIKITHSMQTAYAEAFRDFEEDIRSFAKRRGANFLSVRTDQPIERVLVGELLKVGVMS